MTDIVASLVSAAAVVGLLQLWRPTGAPVVTDRGLRPAGPGGRPAVAGGATHDPTFEREVRRREDGHCDSAGEIAVAYAPYRIIIVVFALAQITWLPFKDFLEHRTAQFDWLGLDVLNAKGEAPTSQTFKVHLGLGGRNAPTRLRSADDAPAAHRHPACGTHLAARR